MHEARKHGYRGGDAAAEFDAVEPEADAVPSESDCVPPYMSDDAITMEFAKKHAGRLRYTATEGGWRVFDGAVWKPDSDISIRDDAREVCRRIASDAGRSNIEKKRNYARVVASRKTIDATEYLARADRSLRATKDQWDKDPWLLNTPDCVVDLRTGATRAHRAIDYMTKITAVSPGGECPIWHRFLDSVTAGDGALKLYLQRAAGYWITGNTEEHALFFCYGTGANGKGVFLNTVSNIMNSYALASNMETFTAAKHARHPTELARLDGARMVTCQETEEGRSWAEALVKSITGGDAITAHFMRQDDFTFTPKLKLVIAGNHRPRINNGDEAMKRRLQLIPFAVHFPEGERDKKLAEKLTGEWGGILQWCIDGCLEWQRIGLAPPDSVRNATSEYFDEEDTIARWIDECCDLGKQHRCGTAELFKSWETWAKLMGEMPGTQTRLTQALKARRFQGEKMPTGRSGLIGLRVRDTEEVVDDFA